ncbi:MAG: acyltransferase, partial [Ramlibacter sp.]
MSRPGRVLGWDLLRGLSALAVALYHLLLWQEVTALHSFGSYGVYLFFLLSGASLAYTYADRFRESRFALRQFLWVRYMRLAPLYLALMLAVLPWKVHTEGWTSDLLRKLVLNAGFLFGFFDPAANAVLIGGWSLGIEAIYYLAFPLLMVVALRSQLAGWGLLALLLALQAVWIARTVGSSSGYAANAVAYHQVPAFAAYFMGGCLIGLARRRAAPRLASPLAMAGVAAGLLGLWLLNPVQAGDELLGWRGAACCALCFAMTWLAGSLEMRHGNARMAASLGDATYGLYLMHPLVFFGLAWVLVPRLGLPPPAQWGV